MNASRRKTTAVLLAATLILAKMVVSAHSEPGPAHSDPLPEGARARLGTLRQRGANALQCLAFSPDGKLLAGGGPNTSLILWDVATGREVHRLTTEDMGALACAFAPDGNLLAASTGRTIHLWDPATGQEVRSFKGDELSQALAFAPDGKLLASAESGAIRLWGLGTGNSLRRLAGSQEEIHQLLFSPDGKVLATGGSPALICLWDVVGGKEVHRNGARVSRNERSAIAYFPDGRTMAYGGAEISLCWWEPATGHERRRFLEPHSGVRAVAFSPDGKLLASGGDDQTIRLAEVATGQEITRVEGHDGAIAAIVFAPDGRTLVSASADATALVWDVARMLLQKQPDSAALRRSELESLWADLASTSAAKAHRAASALLAAPGQSGAFLKEMMRPESSPADDKELSRLVGDLDADDFAVRDKATRELAKLGRIAEPALRQRLKDEPTLEARRRLERLLKDLDDEVLPDETLRGLRAVAVLEHLATTEAHEVLEGLTKGVPAGRLTQDAKAALQRLRLAQRPGGHP
jgi:roadblock/LC7 domain-containing protein